MSKILPLLLLLFIGCMAPWMKVGGPYQDSRQGFSADLPQGWMKLNSNEYLFITRDGVLLQNITIEKSAIDAELKHTKKKLNGSMLPMEAADVIIDDMGADKSRMNFQVLENLPVSIGEKEGFKILFTFNNGDGLKFKSYYSGLISDDQLFAIRYTAPERYYFLKDIAQYEMVLNSFKPF